MVIPKRNALSVYLLREEMALESCVCGLYFGPKVVLYANIILFCVTYVDSRAPRHLGVQNKKWGRGQKDPDCISEWKWNSKGPRITRF